MRSNSFSDFVDLGDEQRSRSGDPRRDRAPVGSIERGDGESLAVDDGALQTLSSSSSSLPVRSEGRPAGSGTSQ